MFREDLAASFDEIQPETQGGSPLDAELGEDGQGDILAEDEPTASDEDPPEDRPRECRLDAVPKAVSYSAGNVLLAVHSAAR